MTPCVNPDPEAMSQLRPWVPGERSRLDSDRIPYIRLHHVHNHTNIHMYTEGWVCFNQVECLAHICPGRRWDSGGVEMP